MCVFSFQNMVGYKMMALCVCFGRLACFLFRYCPAVILYEGLDIRTSSSLDLNKAECTGYGAD